MTSTTYVVYLPNGTESEPLTSLEIEHADATGKIPRDSRVEIGGKLVSLNEFRMVSPAVVNDNRVDLRMPVRRSLRCPGVMRVSGYVISSGSALWILSGAGTALGSAIVAVASGLLLVGGGHALDLLLEIHHEVQMTGYRIQQTQD